MTLNLNNFGISTHVHWFLNCLDKMLKLRQFKFLQNSRTWIINTYWNILFMYLLHCMLYVCLSTYAKNNKPVRLENLTSGQIFFKEYLIWLVRGDSFSKELFRHSINTIREYEKTFNANISIFQEKIIPNSLSKRGGCKFVVAPPGNGPISSYLPSRIHNGTL